MLINDLIIKIKNKYGSSVREKNVPLNAVLNSVVKLVAREISQQIKNAGEQNSMTSLNTTGEMILECDNIINQCGGK